MEWILPIRRRNHRLTPPDNIVESNTVYHTTLVNRRDQNCWLNVLLIYSTFMSIFSPMSVTSTFTFSSFVLSSSFIGSASTFFWFWCVFMCFDRWSLLVNRFPHSVQQNRFSPVCVLRWRWSSSDLVKLLLQNNQLQTNGLSPLCQRKCAFKCEVFP